MDIRPQDLPELRAESVLWHDGHGGTMIKLWRDALRDRNQGNASFALHEAEYARLRWRHEITALGSAELFFVTADMVELTLSAAKSLPAFTVQPDDLPALNGLMVLGTPIATGLRWTTGPGGRDIFLPVRAFCWAIYDGMLSVTPYVAVEDVAHAERVKQDVDWTQLDAPPLTCVPAYMFGTPFGEAKWKGLSQWTTADDLFPILIAAWLLMQQPLAAESKVEIDRAARKRLRRANVDAASVRVIELRRPKSSGEHGDGESNYHHQWIVRGHWRNHWHPKRQVHRPVWIAPHVKGPEGAPMIGGEKVYAWKR
jgi:hypothetical protein